MVQAQEEQAETPRGSPRSTKRPPPCDIPHPGKKPHIVSADPPSMDLPDDFLEPLSPDVVITFPPELIPRGMPQPQPGVPHVCRQFWMAGEFPATSADDGFETHGMDHVRVHPRFLHSNATSHKWVFGAIAELLDNAVDEVTNRATFVSVDVLTNPRNGDPMLVIEDNGGGMDPDCMRHCMSFGYSAKSKLANTIGQYGNGFKTSTMRLGADVLVFTRHTPKNNASPSQSIGLLSYTFLTETGQDDIVVPIIDYDIEAFGLRKHLRGTIDQWNESMDTLKQWSPFSSEVELLDQLKGMSNQGTKIIIYNLWEDDEGLLELDFKSSARDIQIRGASRGNIKLAKKYPSCRHFLTYRHSLRSYASILYLHLPSYFRIFLRGKQVEHHNLINDMMLAEEVTYKPQLRNEQTQGQMKAVVTIGFVKDAKEHVDIQGFSVYHKNRLIKPFWRIWNPSDTRGRGVIGILEANFVEPAHDKQEFERTIVLSRLQTRLQEMQKVYWSKHCHKIGYVNRSSKKDVTPLPNGDGVTASTDWYCVEQRYISGTLTPVVMPQDCAGVLGQHSDLKQGSLMQTGAVNAGGAAFSGCQQLNLNQTSSMKYTAVDASKANSMKVAKKSAIADAPEVIDLDALEMAPSPDQSTAPVLSNTISISKSTISSQTEIFDQIKDISEDHLLQGNADANGHKIGPLQGSTKAHKLSASCNQKLAEVEVLSLVKSLTVPSAACSASTLDLESLESITLQSEASKLSASIDKVENAAPELSCSKDNDMFMREIDLVENMAEFILLHEQEEMPNGSKDLGRDSTTLEKQNDQSSSCLDLKKHLDPNGMALDDLEEHNEMPIGTREDLGRDSATLAASEKQIDTGLDSRHVLHNALKNLDQPCTSTLCFTAAQPEVEEPESTILSPESLEADLKEKCIGLEEASVGCMDDPGKNLQGKEGTTGNTLPPNPISLESEDQAGRSSGRPLSLDGLKEGLLRAECCSSASIDFHGSLHLNQGLEGLQAVLNIAQDSCPPAVVMIDSEVQECTVCLDTRQVSEKDNQMDHVGGCSDKLRTHMTSMDLANTNREQAKATNSSSSLDLVLLPQQKDNCSGPVKAFAAASGATDFEEQEGIVQSSLDNMQDMAVDSQQPVNGSRNVPQSTFPASTVYFEEQGGSCKDCTKGQGMEFLSDNTELKKLETLALSLSDLEEQDGSMQLHTNDSQVSVMNSQVMDNVPGNSEQIPVASLAAIGNPADCIQKLKMDLWSDNLAATTEFEQHESTTLCHIDYNQHQDKPAATPEQEVTIRSCSDCTPDLEMEAQLKDPASTSEFEQEGHMDCTDHLEMISQPEKSPVRYLYQVARSEQISPLNIPGSDEDEGTASDTKQGQQSECEFKHSILEDLDGVLEIVIPCSPLEEQEDELLACMVEGPDPGRGPQARQSSWGFSSRPTLQSSVPACAAGEQDGSVNSCLILEQVRDHDLGRFVQDVEMPLPVASTVCEHGEPMHDLRKNPAGHKLQSSAVMTECVEQQATFLSCIDHAEQEKGTCSTSEKFDQSEAVTETEDLMTDRKEQGSDTVVCVETHVATGAVAEDDPLGNMGVVAAVTVDSTNTVELATLDNGKDEGEIINGQIPSQNMDVQMELGNSVLVSVIVASPPKEHTDNRSQECDNIKFLGTKRDLQGEVAQLSMVQVTAVTATNFKEQKECLDLERDLHVSRVEEIGPFSDAGNSVLESQLLCAEKRAYVLRKRIEVVSEESKILKGQLAKEQELRTFEMEDLRRQLERALSRFEELKANM